jgi:hypothetical protein
MMKKKEEPLSCWPRPKQKEVVEPVAEEQGVVPAVVPVLEVLAVDPVVPVVNFLIL